MIRFDDTQINKGLSSLRDREEEELVQRAARSRNVPYINLLDLTISTDALALIEENKAQKLGIAGFKLVGQQLSVAVLSEQDPEIREVLKSLTQSGYETTVYLASRRSLKKAWSRYDDLRLGKTQSSFLDITEEAIKAIVEQVKTNADVQRLFEEIIAEEELKRTSRLMEILMGSAIATRASDIHLEPQEKSVRIRYRQDGILEDVLNCSPEIFRQLLSRIKILSKLKLNISKNAQDGRFTIDFDQRQIEIRVSTVPSAYGEGVVMRVLDPRGISVGIEELGIEPFLFDILKKEIAKPSGLILNTGPTGSGKTTTLYSFLKYIYNPEIKVITIEDPIEYHLEGIEQTPIDREHGYDFESGLRSAMRHDPDVILVGEIRDHETALAAMQASQTGHLVLSTLHTNNAAGTIPRLLDLGINYATLAQSMTVALAQRLVRTLTPAKSKVRPTPVQENVLRTILKAAEKNGKNLSRFNISSDMDMWVYEPVPDDISPTGFKGRIGIFEAIVIDNKIKEILDKEPTDRQVKEAATHQGILTLAEDAAVKVLQGKTSYDEVARVVDMEEDIRDTLLAQIAEKSGALIKKDSPAPWVDDIRSNLEKESGSIPATRPIISNTVSSSATSLPSREIASLIDYVRMLENHQESYPETGVGEKIQEVQKTIVDLLKNYQPTDLFIQRDNERAVHQEIDALTQELEALKKHQEVYPRVGIADKLRSIRGTLQELVGK